MSNPCECTNVVIYTPGVWRCRICRRLFVPADQVEIAEVQLDVIPVREVKKGELMNDKS